MAITPGQVADASDFINASEKDPTPANNEGKVPKLESDGKISSEFLGTVNHSFTTAETWNALSGLSGSNIVRFFAEISSGTIDVTVDGGTAETISNSITKLYDVTSSLSVVSSTAIDVSTSSYASKSYSVSTQTTGPQGLSFSTDGIKMYISGGYYVYQYNLSTAWDVSTASYSGNNDYILGQGSSPKGLHFNSDGTKMFLINNGTNVYQYTLTTAWNISTSGYASKYIDVSAQESTPIDVSFSSDGTKMFVVGYTTDAVYQYNLSTAWDISTAVYSSKSVSVSAQDTSPQGLSFNSDGTKMFISGTTNDKIYQYVLSTAWDISTASYESKEYSIVSQSTAPLRLFVNINDDIMYIIGATNVYQYNLGNRTSILTTISK